MRIFRYLAKCKGAVALILCLLVVQSACELSLPMFTSQIVDVGIQQCGIEDVATEKMSEATFDSIRNQLSGNESELFSSSYSQNDDSTYSLNDFGRDHIKELDQAIVRPIVVARFSDDVEDSLIAQQAIAAARVEYEELGYNLAGMQMTYLLRVGGLMLALACLGTVVAIAISYIAARTGTKIGANLRRSLFKQVVSFSDAEVQSFSAASLITRGTNDIQQIQMVTTMILRMALFAPIMAVGGIIMIALTDISMGWIVAVGILGVIVMVSFMFIVADPKFKIMQKLIDRVNLVAREILSGAFVIRAFNRQPYEQKRFDVANEELMRTQLFTNRVMAFMMPSMMLIMNAVSIAIVWFGAGFVSEGAIQTGDIIAFITYATVIIMGFLMIGMMSVMLPRANVAAKRIDEVLECKPSIKDPSLSKSRDDEMISKTHSQEGLEIAFRNVDFRYSDNCEYVLEDINFIAEAGKTTAIIGSTGSGKTTLLKLIMRFIDVSSGTIEVDGIDIRDLSQYELRSQIGYAPQKAFLFNGTIRSNVAYCDEEMPNERIDKAIKIAQATALVDSSPDGLNSPITQGGTNISGGQRQRLSIARAIATDARAFLFDDSFSALDYATDAALRSELRMQLAGKTIIIVAQRISTILSADKIIVVDDGRIVGQGTHSELLENCAQYQEIALSQLSQEELRRA